MSNILVSVIIPVYNCEKYIGKVLKDWLSQTHIEMEIIVINDGSTDKTEEVVKKYMEIDSRISLYYTKNLGVSAARNIGLSVAKGKYIRFSDADDKIPANSNELMISVLQNNQKVDMVIGSFITEPDKGYYNGEGLVEGLNDIDTFARDFVKNVRTFYYGVTWNKLYCRDIIKAADIKFNENIIWSEDFLFNIRYLHHCRTVYCIPKSLPIYVYRIYEDSTLGKLTNNKSDIYSKIDVMREEEAKAFFEQKGLKNVFEIEWRNRYIYGDICIAANRKKGIKLAQRYDEFIRLLELDGLYQYIDIKIKDKERLFFWIPVRHAVLHKRYLGAFLYLSALELLKSSFKTVKLKIKRSLHIISHEL